MKVDEAVQAVTYRNYNGTPICIQNVVSTKQMIPQADVQETFT